MDIVTGSINSSKVYRALSKIGNAFVIIATHEVAELYGRDLSDYINASLVTFSGGEKSKTREEAMRIQDELLSLNINKRTAIIALGGGVTTDLAGYVAATTLRGLPLINVPTTLLGMVDAAIGGKNGVNTRHGKNLIGTMYQPRLLVIDHELLNTLPTVERESGMAEVIKTALLFDNKLFESLETAPIETIIESCARHKLHIVQNRSQERDLLNLGHTIGHAIEAASDYTIAHGHAVATGIALELPLSRALSSSEKEQILTTLDRMGYVTQLSPHLNHKELMRALEQDKKRTGSMINTPLLKSIGSSYLAPIPLSQYAELIDEHTRALS